jgi:hypothetical protein
MGEFAGTGLAETGVECAVIIAKKSILGIRLGELALEIKDFLAERGNFGIGGGR